TVASAVLIPLATFSQSLTFNQALLVNNLSTAPVQVPAGKVWKVESYLFNNNNVAADGSARCNSTSNYVQSYYYVGSSSGNMTSFMMKPVQSNSTSSGSWGYGASFPFWVPAGYWVGVNCSSWY